jgi:hypothetical protein
LYSQLFNLFQLESYFRRDALGAIAAQATSRFPGIEECIRLTHAIFSLGKFVG